MSKTKTNREIEKEKVLGKKSYRKRKIEEKEAEEEICSCLDSVFEREAIKQGLVHNPVFPENQEYLRKRQHLRDREQSVSEFLFLQRDIEEQEKGKTIAD